ncbi:neuraminidase-like domain-containing protein [Micromonospora humi]|uniref:Putative peptidoglycan binding domain-containing protein n=1 Tax=Micromonospora humi TaxID=745366 RepID=A0A1C5J0C6_9ACTN|nr:neuraminidase-like domain-containing protein [Micromonospora humi]SCG63995.1 Putative peptidoglycan binding domain-containing protein [Micromonospora humi]
MRALTSQSPGSSGEFVTDLHRALDAVGFGEPVGADEREQAEYGDGTREAVARLQAQLRWPAAEPGVLDRDSAERLNTLLVERGVFQVVEGRLTDTAGAGLAGRLMFAFDVDFVGGALLAEATTDAEGGYRMRYDPRHYAVAGPGVEHPKERLELVLFAYDADGRTIAGSTPLPDPGPRERVDLVAGAAPPVDDAAYTVFGTVREPGGRPVAGVRVRAYDRDLGARRDRLGEAETDADGAFRIAYRGSAFGRGEGRGGPEADLVLDLDVGGRAVTATVYRVFGGAPTLAPLTDDELTLGIPARRDEELALTLTARVPADGTEYARLMAALEPLLDGRSPAELDEERHLDVTFAARETGVDRTLVGHLAQAHRLAHRSFDGRLDAELLYGLARCDRRLTDLPRLTLAGRDELSAGLRQSIERRVIAEQPDEALDAAVALILDLSPDLLLAGAGAPAYGPVLADAVPDARAQRALLRAAAGRADDPAAMWRELRADPDFAEPGAIERAQFALQLDALTDRHLPLMTALQRERGIGSAEALLDLGHEELTALVTRVGLPDGVAVGVDEADRPAVYAAGLLGQAHLAFPTASVARSLAGAPADAVGGEAVRDALPTVLARATGERVRGRGAAFDIGTTRLEPFLTEHADVLFEGIDEPTRAALMPELSRAQRLYRVSTGPAAMDWLIGQSYRSAFDIARLPQQTFLAHAADLDAPQAMMIHSKAQQTATAMLATYAHLVDARLGVDLAALQGGDRVEAAAAIDRSIATYLPTWGALFGDVSWCECDHCRSVYSPAAYLVDLLAMLDTAAPNGSGQRPLDVLLTRRPDLAQIPLTCENTNTTIPYVDLVNEVLESLVGSLDPAVIPAYDTDGVTAAELAAAPQHTDWAAYVTPPAATRTRLDRAAYPNSLPFDAALDAARAHLAHLGVARADLLETFADGTPAHALAAERLGLTPATFALITGVDLAGAPADAVDADERFGFTAVTPPTLADGDSGWWVWALRRKLAAAGAALTVGADPARERFDAPVTAAVTAFQTAQGLPATGHADAATWSALAAHGPSYAVSLLPHTPLLLDRAGIGYDELLALLRTRFLNPAQHAFETVQGLHLPGADLVAFVTGGLVNPSPALTAALGAAGRTVDEFTDWAGTHLAGPAWDRLRATVLVDGPLERAVDAVTVRHWADDEPWLTDDEWVRLDRLVRLWRATGWELDDLDLTLTALGAGDLDAATVTAVARVADLARTLDVAVAQVVLLWADLDPTRPGSLYHRRLRNRALLRLDPAFDPDWRGQVLPGATVGDHLATLQAGMRVPAADLAALRAHLGLADDTAPLDVAAVSAMFRHVTLARAVEWNVRDLITMITLSGVDPFTAPGSGDWTARTLVGEIRRLRRGDLDPTRLAGLLADLSTPHADAGRDRVLGALRDGLRTVAADLDPTVGPPDALVRRALAATQVPAPLVDAAAAILTGNDQTVATLPTPPAPAPAIPAAWSTRLRWSPADRTVTVVGALTDAEHDEIRTFTADPGWAAAVDRLHALPRAVLTDLSTALAAAGITAPTTLLATPLPDDPGQREAAVDARTRLLLDAVLPAVRDREQRALIRQTMLAVLPDAATVALLLEGRRTAGGPALRGVVPGTPLITDLLALADAPDVTDPARQGYELLARVQLLAEGHRLPGADLRVLVADVVTLRADGRRLLDLPAARAIGAYARVRARPGQPDGALAALWSATTDEQAATALAAAAGVPATTITDLADPAGLNLALPALRDPVAVERLVDAAAVVTTLGVPTVTAAGWARRPTGQDVAEDTRRAVKARYDDDAWLDVAASLTDAQRDRRRAALVAYLAPRLGVRDADGLYQQLLVDVEMSPCMRTSRIKQAISSVQLFIQRVLLNHEAPAVTPQAVDAGHWRWMRNYRVWEANRKVLLYPENWILPQLRDDKTPFFKDLEGVLLSEDLTEAAAERAVAGYLEKLDTVAKLDVTALHVQHDFEPAEKLQTVVHLFGRTANTPQVYHYRRYVVTADGTARWTPWEQVPVDVRGELVTAVTFNRRLYLFWAQVTTKTRPAATGATSAQPPRYYQEVQLAWSEYRDGAWGPKRVTDGGDVLVADYDPDDDDATTAQGTPRPPGVVERLETRIEGDRLRVLCVANRTLIWSDDEKKVSYQPPVLVTEENALAADGNQAYTYALGTFVVDGCHGRMTADRPDQTWLSTGALLRVSADELQVKPLTRSKPVRATTVLGRAPGMRIGVERWAHSDSGYFVVGDDRRAYFGRLRLASPTLSGVIGDPARIYPGLDLTPRGTDVVAVPELPWLVEAGHGAEVAGNGWGGANATLARAALTAPRFAVADSRLARELPHAAALTVDKPLTKELAVALEIERIGAIFARPKVAATVELQTFFDPFVCTYLKRLQQYGVSGLLTPANQQLVLTPGFAERYQPDPWAVSTPYPSDNVDFGLPGNPGLDWSSAQSGYHRELFFDIPMLIGDMLADNHRYEEALRFYHHVFDPTDGTGDYWKVLPLRTTGKETVEQWLARLNSGDADLKRQIAEWKDHPFQPHLLARMRPTAYKKQVVMRYLDALIGWGDKLYAQDTMESINQATNLYVLAAELCGPAMRRVPAAGEPAPQTFAQMRGKLDALGNVAAEFENTFPTLNSATLTAAPESAGLLGLGRTLYFCVPPNDKLLGYWDTVADRLFKIRNCMNLAGVVRQLPLFEPPIDPALLVRAAAQGIDLGSVVADVNASLPPHRFEVVLRRAQDACATLRGLGQSLLAALEQRDGEELAALRAEQELLVLNATLETRRRQEDEADARLAALRDSRAVPAERLRYHRWLMGAEDKTPEPGQVAGMVSYAPATQRQDGVFLIQEEINQLASAHSARDWQVRANAMEIIASLSYYIPSFAAHVEPFGVGAEIEFGGKHIGPALTAISRHLAGMSYEDSYDADHAGKMAGYRRRGQEYAIGANAAALELAGIDKQVTTMEITKELATLERRQVEKQIAEAQLVQAHLSGKYTDAELYGWLQGQLSGLYHQAYQHAYELARQAERCHRFERGLTDGATIVRAGAWDSLRKGLLAGERLHLQLQQLQRAHADLDVRDHELTKHVSLRQHAPLALIRLRETGRCEIDLPELLFDLDHPGHYLRRVKSVSLTVPAVVGPYGGVNARLVMLSNETRVSPALRAGRYERDADGDDPRFVRDFAAVQQIATSGGQNDSGLFEVNFHDERYLPFEGAGAAGRWRLEIDPDCNAFDLGSVSDVVLHLRYTARDGGEQLRQKAKERWKKVLADVEGLPLSRLFSLRHEFPGEWHRLRTVAEPDGSHTQLVTLSRDRFPVLMRASRLTVGAVDVFGVPTAGGAPTRLPALRTPEPAGEAVALADGVPLPPLLHQRADLGPVAVTGDGEQARWRLTVAAGDVAASLDQLDDVLLVCHYSARAS